MQKTVTECDMCGKIKGETNHWFSIFLSVSPDSKDAKGFTCIRGIRGISVSADMRHVCGQACATKFFQRFLSNGTLEPDVPKEEVDKAYDEEEIIAAIRIAGITPGDLL